jgi:hypothetical protein
MCSINAARNHNIKLVVPVTDRTKNYDLSRAPKQIPSYPLIQLKISMDG